MGWSARPANGRLGVPIPGATDIGGKKGSDSSTAERSAQSARVMDPLRLPL